MHEVTIPSPGQTVEEVLIVSWLKSAGEAVCKGEALAEIETDKAVFELESPADGVLLKILHPEGSSVAVRALVALVGEAGEDAEAYAAKAAAKPAEPSAPGARPRGPEGQAAQVPQAARPGAAPGAAPAARQAAARLGVNLAEVKGSGPGGLITSADVEKHAQSRHPEGAAAPSAAATAGQAPGQGAVRRPLSRMRKAIAANLSWSTANVPYFFMRATIDASGMERFCEAQKARFACGINDVIVRACAKAVMEFPEFRSCFDADGVIEMPAANIGIAVASPEGLTVPVVVGADSMTLEQLAGEIRRVVGAAREGRMIGGGQGVFSVTNLGMFGVEEFTAIINPPESAILAVGAVRDAAVVRDGAARAGRVMTVTLASDHRIIDGVAAAKFLARLKELLEKPEANL